MYAVIVTTQSIAICIFSDYDFSDILLWIVIVRSYDT